MADTTNPANPPQTTVSATSRIPMSVPRQKLSVPPIPGWHLHWMIGTSDRIAQALRAGYVFVKAGEVDVPNHSVAGDRMADGNTSLGSNISVVAGGYAPEGGQHVSLILMKIPLEFWESDQKAIESRSDALVTALRNGQLSSAPTGERSGEQGDDARHRYIDRQRTRSTMFDKQRRS